MKSLRTILGEEADLQVAVTFSCKHDSFGQANFDKILDFGDCTLKDLANLAKSSTIITIQNTYLRKADRSLWDTARKNSGTGGIEGKTVNVAEICSPKARLSMLDREKKLREAAELDAAARKLWTDTLIRLIGEGKPMEECQKLATKITMKNYPDWSQA